LDDLLFFCWVWRIPTCWVLDLRYTSILPMVLISLTWAVQMKLGLCSGCNSELLHTDAKKRRRCSFWDAFQSVWNGKNNGDSGILWICRLFAPDLKSSLKGLFMIVCSVIFFHLVSPSLEVTRRSSVPVLTSFNRFMHFVAAEIPVLQQAWTSLHLTVHHLQGGSVALSTF